MADSLSLNTRAYNSFHKGPNGLTLIKKSNNAKLADEIDYYRTLPPSLQLYFPRFVSGVESGGNFELELENLPGLNAGEILVFGDRPKEFWLELFRFCKRYIEDYKACGSVPAQKSDMIAMLIEKTEREYQALIDSNSHFSYLQRPSIPLNYDQMPSFAEVWGWAKEKLIAFQEERFYITHGDFHLSNILVLEHGDNRTFKFVDPRGSFGSSKPWGSAIYDIAKMFHSFTYAYFITDQFYLNKVDDAVSSEHILAGVPRSLSAKRAIAAFWEVLFTPQNRQIVSIIAATQFIGMAARHAPEVKRQEAMILTGLSLFNHARLGLW